MPDEIPPQSIRDEMEQIYRSMSPADIPWNIQAPPQPLVELVESGQVAPCKTLDVGCGAGNHAVYLASKGFDVTGVDVSPSAIKLARQNARKNSVTCNFLVADLLEGMEDFVGTFEFVHEWSVLHHIYPEQRERHVETVHQILVPGGKYFSVCFSDRDPAFDGTRKIRRTSIGTVLCFSSENDLKKLFQPHFRVLRMKTEKVEGKKGPHLMNVAFMEKHIIESV
ncbi:MAG: class I SAM-dependent methyltransferase [Pirellulaceae bacterium]